jgi:hypothetical membrane protein
MNLKAFAIGLAITVFCQALLNALLLLFIDGLDQHIVFIAVSMLVMMGFCLLLFGASHIMARSRMTKLFIQLVMIAVFLKLLLCLALIVIYKEAFQPENLTFIWSFLIIYITTTVYEVVFLEKVGRQKPPAA